MRLNAGSCLVPLVCHLVATMHTTRKLVESTVPSLSRLRKVFAVTDLIPTAPSVAFWFGFAQPWPGCHVPSWPLDYSVNLAGLPGISIPAGFAQVFQLVAVDRSKYSWRNHLQAAAAFEATTDYHKQQPLISEVTNYWTLKQSSDLKSRWVNTNSKFSHQPLPTLGTSKMPIPMWLTGLSGVLPVLNKGVVDAGIKAAGAEYGYPSFMHWRKNYFYLMIIQKACQISQFDRPIGYNGWIEVQLKAVPAKKIRDWTGPLGRRCR